jgi:iron complex transport system permease protein
MSAPTWPAGAQPTPAAAAPQWRRWLALMLLLAGAGGLLFWLSLAIGVGSVTLGPGQVWRALTAPASATRLEVVAANARLVRALLALGVGAALGLAGALLQALYRNPLADPSLTGVTNGAVTAAVAWTVFGPPVAAGQVVWVLPLVSAAGALLAAAATWGLTRLTGRVEPVRLILIGVLVGGVLGAITSMTLLLAGENSAELIRWMTGSLATASWPLLRLFVGAALACLPLTLLAIPRANVLQLGDEVASGLGQAPTPARLLVLVAACGLTAAAVCTIGGIGFVGLVAPHLCRWAVGSDLRRLTPAAALGGGAVVLAADFVARNLRPTDVGAWLHIPMNTYTALTLPVGIYLALGGAPIFLWLLRRTRP